LAFVARVSTPPTVSFHWYDRARGKFEAASYPYMLPVLTRQPPGSRMNPGSSAAIFSARSRRSPFGRPLYVSRGKSDTMSSRSVPVPAARTESRPRSVVRAARSVPVYFAHPSPVTVTASGAASGSPAASCSPIVSGVPPVASVRAQIEKS
jgi:hypothetical protein